MCTNCIIKLNNTFKFRQQCRDAETQLKKQLKETNLLSMHSERSIQNSVEENSEQFETTVKIEVESRNDYDLDDDMPLKLLINSETLDLKLSPKYEPKEDETSIFDTSCSVTDNEIKVEDIKEENSEPPDIDIKSNPKLTQNELNYYCDTNQIHGNNIDDKKIAVLPTVLKTKEVVPPYEVIMDSVTQKATRVLCKLCNKELSIRSIDFHMSRCHPGADERKVKCEMCDVFVLKNKLNRHMMLTHGSEGFKCGVSKD